MVNNFAGFHIGQAFEGETVAFFFLFNPGHQRLLHHPPTRAVQALREMVYLCGERRRDMGGKNARVCGGHCIGS